MLKSRRTLDVAMAAGAVSLTISTVIWYFYDPSGSDSNLIKFLFFLLSIPTGICQIYMYSILWGRYRWKLLYALPVIVVPIVFAITFTFGVYGFYSYLRYVENSKA